MEFNVGDDVYIFTALGDIKRVTIFQINNHVGEDWYSCLGWVKKMVLKRDLHATKEALLKYVADQLEGLE